MSKVLLVIDVQNDYFPGGAFTLWNSEAVLKNIETAIATAKSQGIPTVHVQHVVPREAGPGPFFNAGTHGVKIHERVLAAAPDAPIIEKQHADSFEKTLLEKTLAELNATELLVCGMMTQNCVTHTAISKAAEKYKVSVIPECCTTVSEVLHALALHALSDRLPLVPADQAI